MNKSKTIKLGIVVCVVFVALVYSFKNKTPVSRKDTRPIAFSPVPTKILVTPQTQEIQDAARVILVKYQAWETGRWNEFYSALHPDSQALITKEDFIAYWESKREGFPITNPVVRDLKLVESEIPPGFEKTYTQVAEVVVKYNQILAGKEIITQDGVNYLVQDRGEWKILWKKP